MAQTFDPHYAWLGIAPEEQPAHHYRLLGLKLFEANETVIRNAAEQRIAYLKTRQTEAQGAVSLQVAREVAAAARCLLTPETKADYDRKLQASLVVWQPGPPPAVRQPPLQDSQPAPPGTTRRGMSSRNVMVIGGVLAGCALLLIAAIAVTLLNRGNKPNRKKIAQADRNPPPVPAPKKPRGKRPLDQWSTATAPAVGSQLPPKENLPPHLPYDPEPDHPPVFGIPTAEQLNAARPKFYKEHPNPRNLPKEEARAKVDALMQLAMQTRDDPAWRYVLLEEAAKRYAEQGEVQLAVQATQRLRAWHRIPWKESMPLLTETLQHLALRPMSKENAELLADIVAGEVESALRYRQFDDAQKLAEVSRLTVNKFRDPDRLKLSGELQRLAGECSRAERDFRSAEFQWRKRPDHMPFNLAMAKYHCLLKEDWRLGKYHLADAGIAGMSRVLELDWATDEIPQPSVSQCLAAGDAWLEWVNQGMPGDAELIKIAQMRGKLWFTAAASDATGADKELIGMRLQALANVPQPAPREAARAALPAAADLAQQLTPVARGGDWLAQAGEIEQRRNRGQAVYQLGSPQMINGTIECEVQAGEGSGSFGIGLHAEEDFMILAFVSKQEFIIGQFHKHGATYLNTTPLQTTADPNRWHKLRLNARGPRFSASLNEGLNLEVGLYEGCRSGRAVLYTSDRTARFRNLRLTDGKGKVLLEGAPALP